MLPVGKVTERLGTEMPRVGVVDRMTMEPLSAALRDAAAEHASRDAERSRLRRALMEAGGHETMDSDPEQEHRWNEYQRALDAQHASGATLRKARAAWGDAYQQIRGVTKRTALRQSLRAMDGKV